MLLCRISKRLPSQGARTALKEQKTQDQGIITNNISLKGFCVNRLYKKISTRSGRLRREKSREVDLYTLWNSALLPHISLTIGRSVGYITTKYAPRVLLSLITKESHLGTRCASVGVDRS